MCSRSYYAYKMCGASQLEELADKLKALSADKDALHQLITTGGTLMTDYPAAPEEEVFDSMQLWLQWHTDGSVELLGQVYIWEVKGSAYRRGTIRRFSNTEECAAFVNDTFNSAETIPACFYGMRTTPAGR